MNALEFDALNALANALTCSEPEFAGLLLGELDRATVYSSGALPDQTVVMNSIVEYVDEVSGRIRIVKLVFPNRLGASTSHVSITSPVGIALIGLSVGDTTMCRFPNGRQRRLRVLGVTPPDESSLA
ncbi:GreA/GreB family elongation factor [Hyphomonas johnsonii MHS-2]|jgi:regulator of nucleoside diphosphate kinase|uniref:GreA/GreB family elongation factor n=2 Tax=Hyphomonas johnsonii TaxID=81031 RepID=A0A059FS30_9PROT|nr:GreA/GreB family elongation factor [Hyphomonas johnsonii MHS-2]